MTISEAQRFEMHLGLRDKLGDVVANTLMEHLPPSGWSDVARAKDLEAVEKRLDARITGVETSIKGLRTTLHLAIASFVAVSATIIVMLVQLNQAVSGG